MNQQEHQQIGITMEELQQIIGELEIMRRKQFQQLQQQMIQIQEMSAEITKLREENGRLVKEAVHADESRTFTSLSKD